MGAASVSIDAGEVFSLAKILKDVRLSSTDRKDLLTALGTETEAQTQERFVTKTNPDGNRWQDISNATKKAYEKLGINISYERVLQRSGGLLDSIESQASSWDVLVGATKIYAATHQFGWEDIPPRPYLGISSEDVTSLEDIVIEFLQRKMK